MDVRSCLCEYPRAILYIALKAKLRLLCAMALLLAASTVDCACSESGFPFGKRDRRVLRSSRRALYSLQGSDLAFIRVTLTNMSSRSTVYRFLFKNHSRFPTKDTKTRAHALPRQVAVLGSGAATGGRPLASPFASRRSSCQRPKFPEPHPNTSTNTLSVSRSRSVPSPSFRPLLCGTTSGENVPYSPFYAQHVFCTTFPETTHSCPSSRTSHAFRASINCARRMR